MLAVTIRHNPIIVMRDKLSRNYRNPPAGNRAALAGGRQEKHRKNL
jgi:hypothetical protein